MKELPVTNAFCNWPLKPVAQGLIVTTLLARQHRRYTADMASRNETAPAIDDNTHNLACFLCVFAAAAGLMMGGGIRMKTGDGARSNLC